MNIHSCNAITDWAQPSESVYPVLKAVAEPNRLRILCSLGMDCRPVTDIIATSGLSQTLVSFHLRVLREAGLVRADRRGSFIYYCLTDPELLRILHGLTVWLMAHQGDEQSISAPIDGSLG